MRNDSGLELGSVAHLSRNWTAFHGVIVALAACNTLSVGYASVCDASYHSIVPWVETIVQLVQRGRAIVFNDGHHQGRQRHWNIGGRRSSAEDARIEAP